MFIWQPARQSAGDRFGELIRVVAERSAAELREQFDAWPAMDVAELRGYVRARMGGCVRRQLRLATCGGVAIEQLPPDVLSLARERAVHLVVREHLLHSQLPVVRRAAA
jgi:hypothetical protein